MYQPRAVPDSQDDPAFGVRRVPSLSPEKRGAALGPTQGQVDARRNLSLGAEIVSAETFALWCDTTRVESVDDCLAKSGQSALRLVTVHHSDPETADFCEGARERSRAVDHHVYCYEFRIGSYWPIIGELKMHRSRATLDPRVLPTSSTRRTTRRLAVVRRSRRARSAEDGRVPRDISILLSDDQVDERLDRLPRMLREALYPFQLDGVRYGLARGGRCLIADQMGVGKTIQALALGACFWTTARFWWWCPRACASRGRGKLSVGYPRSRLEICTSSTARGIHSPSGWSARRRKRKRRQAPPRCGGGGGWRGRRRRRRGRRRHRR